MVLAEVKRGKEVSIKNLSEVNHKLRRRLISLGFDEGQKLHMKQKAMLNGPCTLESRGRSVSIRHQDAMLIEVETV